MPDVVSFLKNLFTKNAKLEPCDSNEVLVSAKIDNKGKILPAHKESK